MNGRSERGQILIIGAAAMVILIGIAGLVIDLGFSWMLRRAEQNAVDSATIAAARYIPDGDLGAMEEAACFYAVQNGFFPAATSYDLGSSGCVPANDPNGTVLDVIWPSTNTDFPGSDYVQVTLDSAHATFFGKIFGFDLMAVSSHAVAANSPGDSGVGQLVALDPTSCGAGLIRGNGTTYVQGTIYVNSDGTQPPPGCVGPFDDDCSGSNGAFSFEGDPARLVTAQLSIRGTCGQNSNPYPGNCAPPSSCGLTEGAPQIDDPFNLPTPTIAWAGVPAPGTSDSGGPPNLANCDSPTDTGCTFAGGPGTWYLLNPGVYYGGWMIQRPVYLNPGFYYFAGGGIQVSGNGALITIGPSGYVIDPITGQPSAPDLGEGRILLYGTDGPDCATTGGRTCQGTITLTGQGGFQAKAYEQDPSDPFDDSFQRILIWQAEGTSMTLPSDTDLSNDEILIAGQGDMDFWGTIYAPKSRVTIFGNGNGLGSVAGVQILAWQFNVGGNGNLNMPFDPDELSPILNKGLVQ